MRKICRFKLFLVKNKGMMEKHHLEITKLTQILMKLKNKVKKKELKELFLQKMNKMKEQRKLMMKEARKFRMRKMKRFRKKKTSLPTKDFYRCQQLMEVVHRLQKMKVLRKNQRKKK